MKRDMDLFKAILEAIEDKPSTKHWTACPLLGYPIEDVVGHLRLIADAGLVDARFVSPINNGAGFAIRITNEGHDFLEAARKPQLWAAAKKKIIDAGVPLTVGTLQMILNGQIKQHLGLP